MRHRSSDASPLPTPLVATWLVPPHCLSCYLSGRWDLSLIDLTMFTAVFYVGVGGVAMLVVWHLIRCFGQRLVRNQKDTLRDKWEEHQLLIQRA